MLKDNKHIDGLFADGLKNLSVPPSAKVWEGVSGQMLAAKKKRLFAIYIWTGVAASILLLLAIGNRYLTNQPNYNMQLETLSENISSQKGESQTKIEFTESEKAIETNVDVESKLNNNELFGNDKKLTTGKLNAELQIEFKGDRLALKEQLEISEKLNNSNTNSSELLAGLNEEKKISDYWDEDYINHSVETNQNDILANTELTLPNQLQANTSQLKKEPSFSLLADEIQIQKNILALEELKQKEFKEKRWSIIGQVSSTFSSYSGNKKGSNAESGIWSVGGGAKVNYAMNEKLAFQTGIVYNRFGQDMSSGRGNGLMYSDASNPVGGELTERVAVYPAQTSAGVIKLNSSEVAKNNDLSEYASSYVSSDYLIQSFKSIEIPLLMRYNLLQKRLGMFVSGGLSANMIVGNGVYDQSQGNKKIGEIDGIRTTNFSSQFSFGFEYRLSPKLQIGLEPSMKYYLNSINKSSQYQYRPYSIGVFTGIKYDF